MELTKDYEMLSGRESSGGLGDIGLQIYTKVKKRLADGTVYAIDAKKLYGETGPEGERLRHLVYELERALEQRVEELNPDGPEIRAAERKSILGCFLAAGVAPIYEEEVPNGYWPDSYGTHRPWFRVTTGRGVFVIGWRKSVISIDWKETTLKKSGQELFPDEDVTRWETGIHAWGEEKAAQYLRALHAEQR